MSDGFCHAFINEMSIFLHFMKTIADFTIGDNLQSFMKFL